ncbi:hypothetical protein ACJX0J_034803, partial [Zea mays]
NKLNIDAQHSVKQDINDLHIFSDEMKGPYRVVQITFFHYKQWYIFEIERAQMEAWIFELLKWQAEKVWYPDYLNLEKNDKGGLKRKREKASCQPGMT